MLKKFVNRRGFTDRLYFANLKFTWIFTILCLILTIFSGFLNITDMSIVSVGMGVVWGELSLHTGFIIWKAKTENCIKKNKEIELFDINDKE